MPRMPDEQLQEEWPQIIDKTTKLQRGKGIRAFEIKDARNTWQITGRLSPSGSIYFFIQSYPNYEFIMTSDGEISCHKVKIERVGDSGKLACVDGRFNVIDNLGERKTIRTHNLRFYIKDAFSGN